MFPKWVQEEMVMLAGAAEALTEEIQAQIEKAGLR